MTIQELHQEFLQSAGICTDTRQVCSDSIFVALKGENFDGNRFVPDALDKGCRIAITVRTDLPPDQRILVVPSALEALQQLAHFHRMKQGARILAITGSNGKTTTKELIARVLEKKYGVASTRGNLNNHIGVPLTLLSLKEEEVAVVEMGANHPGEIGALCEIASPGTGLITNVGKAHLEGFGSLKGVLRAKTEMYKYLAASGGTALIDGSDATLIRRAGEIGVDTRTIGPKGDLMVHCRVTGQTPFLEVELQMEGKNYPVPTQLVGTFNLQNILLAAGAGLHFGVPSEDIAAAIAGYVPTNNRSQFIQGKRNQVIMDAYNANPSSMQGAVEGLLAVGKPPLMLILGQMAELGETSADEHLTLLRRVTSLPVDRLLLVGAIFSEVLEDGSLKLSEGEPSGRITVFNNTESLETYLEAEPPEGYHILVKGSRVNELERIIRLL